MDIGLYKKLVCKYGKVLLFYLFGVYILLKILYCVIINFVFLFIN